MIKFYLKKLYTVKPQKFELRFFQNTRYNSKYISDAVNSENMDYL